MKINMKCGWCDNQLEVTVNGKNEQYETYCDTCKAGCGYITVEELFDVAPNYCSDCDVFYDGEKCWKHD